MQEEHSYHVAAWWSSGRTGIAKTESAPNAIHFTAPSAFGGIEGRWTPEDLLLCAVASCFTATFHVLAGYAKFEYTDLAVEAEAVASRADSGYRFSEIVLRPTLTISREQERKRALDLLQKTQSLCLVSRALTTPQKFESCVKVGKLSPEQDRTKESNHSPEPA